MLSQSAPISAFLGQLGSKIIYDTTACTGTWGEVYALADAVFTTLISGNLANGTTMCTTASGAGTLATAVGTLKTGTYIRGYFTAITLTSGTVIAYNV